MSETKRSRRGKTNEEKIKQINFGFRLSEKDLRKEGMNDEEITDFFNEIAYLKEKKLSYHMLGKKSVTKFLSERRKFVSVNPINDYEEEGIEKAYYSRLLSIIESIGVEKALEILNGEKVPHYPATKTTKKLRPSAPIIVEELADADVKYNVREEPIIKAIAVTPVESPLEQEELKETDGENIDEDFNKIFG
ncbi:hypothetical protein [Lysinibacillus xylanilyticus]|uniref:Uncharacterized protein n=1 Tax=Lysinibacillus xylanilyticus TaxID=582475 RepID=A0ABV3W030_9BACI